MLVEGERGRRLLRSTERRPDEAWQGGAVPLVGRGFEREGCCGLTVTVPPSRFKVPSASPSCPSNLSIVSEISLLIDIEFVLMPL